MQNNNSFSYNRSSHCFRCSGPKTIRMCHEAAYLQTYTTQGFANFWNIFITASDQFNIFKKQSFVLHLQNQYRCFSVCLQGLIEHQLLRRVIGRNRSSSHIICGGNHLNWRRIYTETNHLSVKALCDPHFIIQRLLSNRSQIWSEKLGIIWFCWSVVVVFLTTKLKVHSP